LHLLFKPESVIENIVPEVWTTLLSSLNAWEMLLLKEWVHVGLSEGPLTWNYNNSETLRMIDEASKVSLPYIQA
jgi:hypothetical protein